MDVLRHHGDPGRWYANVVTGEVYQWSILNTFGAKIIVFYFKSQYHMFNAMRNPPSWIVIATIAYHELCDLGPTYYTIRCLLLESKSRCKLVMIKHSSQQLKCGCPAGTVNFRQFSFRRRIFNGLILDNEKSNVENSTSKRRQKIDCTCWGTSTQFQRVFNVEKTSKCRRRDFNAIATFLTLKKH